MRSFFLWVLVGLAIFMGYYITTHDKKLLGPEIVRIGHTIKVAVGLESEITENIPCSLQFSSPLPNSHVQNLISVQVLVDNTKEDCTPWPVFEGHAGTVTLYDMHDKALDTGELNSAFGGIASAPTTYTTTLSDFTYVGKAKLVMKPDAAFADEDVPQSFMTLIIDQN